MVRFFIFLIQFSISFASISQEKISFNLERLVDENLATIRHSFSIPKGNWKNAYERLNLDSISFDSTYTITSEIDYFQTIFQAYNNRKMSKSFFDNQVIKWGLDTLKLSKQPIRAYISAVLTFKDGVPNLIIDKNNNGIIKDDKIYPKNSAIGMHTLLFDRFQNGIVKEDSATILINNIDYKEKRVLFKYVEKRIGAFNFQNKIYNVELEAKLNDYSFDELFEMTVSSEGQIIGRYTLNNIIKFGEGLSFQISNISRDGQTIELTRYKKEKQYSPQIGNYLPVFEGTDINGKKVGIEDFKGKYTLVYFWNSSCSASTYSLKELVKKMMESDYGLSLFSIALDKRQNIPKELIGNDKRTSLIVESATGPINKIFRNKVFPTYYFLNPAGKILLKSDMGINPVTFEKDLTSAMELDRKLNN